MHSMNSANRWQTSSTNMAPRSEQCLEFILISVIFLFIFYINCNDPMNKTQLFENWVKFYSNETREGAVDNRRALLQTAYLSH